MQLSTNKVSLNPRKYVFTGDYVLTIRDVTFDDEGWYRCDVTSSHVDRYIKVIGKSFLLFLFLFVLVTLNLLLNNLVGGGSPTNREIGL